MNARYADVAMHAAEKYRIKKCGHDHKDEPRRVFLMKNCGCKRKVHNLLVDFLYRELEKLGFVNGPIPDSIVFPEVTYFKAMEEYKYLGEADSLALANARLDFLDSIKDYNEKYDHESYTKRALRRDASGTEPLSFRGLKGMPKFHSRARGDVSYTTNCQYPNENNNIKRPTVRLEGNKLHLPKMKKGLGDLELVIHRPFPEGAVIGNVTVSMGTDGEMYASVEYSYTIKMPMALRDAAVSGDSSVLPHLKILALDYSQEDFYVDSEGRKANYPHYYRESEEKLARLKRQLSRMEYDPGTHTGSKNYERKLHQIQKLEQHIVNQRRDFLQKLSTELAGEYDAVIVEDIDLRAMGGGLKLGRNLHDNGFGMFRDMLAYKLGRKGSVLVKVDKWFPSTKRCSECGYINRGLTLDDREWVCPVCGKHHDRDGNAAANIKGEGTRILLDYFAQWLAEDEERRRKAKALQDGRKSKKKQQPDEAAA